MGAEGLEPSWENAEKTSFSKSAGAHTGAIDSDFDVQGHLKPQAIEDLQKALRSLRRLEDRSNSPAEVVAASRALAFVERAIEELEMVE